MLTPVIRGSILLDQAIARSNEQYINTYTGEVHNDSLKQSDLERAIEETKSQIAFNERLLNEHFEQDAVDLREVSNLQDKISSYRKIQHDLEEKLRKLLAFNAKSPSFFQEIEALENAVNQGMALANKSWSPTSKSFSLPSREEMGWTDIIEGKWEEKDYSQDDLNYKESLKVQYGFDDKTSRIIVKLRRNIYNNPKIRNDRKDQVFARLLGGLYYSNEDDSFIKKVMWNTTAGEGQENLDDRDVVLTMREQYKEYGKLTDEEYEYLNYKVRIQHGNYGDFDNVKRKYGDSLSEFKKNMETALGYKISDDEFKDLWNKQINSFKGKTDFAHQYIIIATHLYENPRVPDLLGGHEYTNNMSGWLGDTTNIADVDPSIGNDDYKADLDSVNITSIMKKDNISFIEASNKYYNNIENGNYNRAEEFKKNVDFDDVKRKIYAQLGEKIKDSEGRTIKIPRDIKYIKENYPQTYNFIKSLENNQHNLKDYYNDK